MRVVTPDTIESHYPPFIAWLREHDVEVERCIEVIIGTDVMLVVLERRDAGGRPLLESNGTRIATTVEHRWITTRPPLHPVTVRVEVMAMVTSIAQGYAEAIRAFGAAFAPLLAMLGDPR